MNRVIQMVHTVVPEIPRAKSYVPLPAAQQDGVQAQPVLPGPAIPLKLGSVLTPSVPAAIMASVAGIYQFSGQIGLLPSSIIRQIAFVRRSPQGVVTPIEVNQLVDRDHFDFFFQAYFGLGDEFLILMSNPKLVKLPQTTIDLEFFPNNVAMPVAVTGFTNLIQVRFLGSEA